MLSKYDNGLRLLAFFSILTLMAFSPVFVYAQSGSRSLGGGGSRSSSRSRGGGGALSRGISRSRTRNLSGLQRYSTRSLPANTSNIGAVTVPGRGFAVIEMFSSFDCEKCEQADKNMAWISSVAKSRKLPVYALSFDNQADSNRATNSFGAKRQKFYDSWKSNSEVQVIINGQAPLTGDKQSATQTIQSALGGRSRTSIKVTAAIKKQKINVALKWRGRNNDDVIHIALAEDMSKRGDAMPTNLVRDFKTIPVRNKDNMIVFELPENFKRENYHVIAYIQSIRDASISAAAKAVFK